MKNFKNLVVPITILSIILFVIILFTVLCLTVFTIKNIEVNLLLVDSSSTYSNEQAREELNTENIMGNSVVFFNRKDMEAKIEKLLPKIEVVNLEVVFPNILRINCKERIETFAIKIENSKYNYAIVDEDFKVIRNSNNTENYPLISVKDKNGDAIIFDDSASGDFITFGDIEVLKGFFIMLNRKGETQAEIVEMFEDINAFYRTGELSLQTRTKSGYDVKWYNIKMNTSSKIDEFLSIINGENDKSQQYIID